MVSCRVLAAVRTTSTLASLPMAVDAASVGALSTSRSASISRSQRCWRLAPYRKCSIVTASMHSLRFT